MHYDHSPTDVLGQVFVHDKSLLILAQGSCACDARARSKGSGSSSEAGWIIWTLKDRHSRRT